MRKAMNMITSVLGVLLLLFAAYAAYPLYMTPTSTASTSNDPDDWVSWTFRRYPSNPEVYQKLTVWRDGRNEVEITREFTDYDTEMISKDMLKWEIAIYQKRGIRKFTRKGILSQEQATKLFKKALAGGVLDVRSIKKSNDGCSLDLAASMGGNAVSATGPDRVGAPVAFPPGKWVMRKRWKALAKIVDDDPAMRVFMVKTAYTEPVK